MKHLIVCWLAGAALGAFSFWRWGPDVSDCDDIELLGHSISTVIIGAAVGGLAVFARLLLAAPRWPLP